MIEARGLTKRYGAKTAVDHLSFTVEPGRVTGFLGPNGAGKSTTMRLILGLDRPQSGAATINGHRYADLPTPLRVVGALLEAKAMHTGRSAYNHLLAQAQTHAIGRDRDDWFFVNLHKAGTCSLTQGRQTHTPEVGDFSFHDSTRPFHLRFHDDMALTCFFVPQSALLARTTGAHSAVAKPLPSGGAGMLFRNFASALAQAAS